MAHTHDTVMKHVRCSWTISPLMLGFSRVLGEHSLNHVGMARNIFLIIYDHKLGSAPRKALIDGIKHDEGL